MPGYNDLNIGMDFISNPVMPGSPSVTPQPVMPQPVINTPDPIIEAPKKSLFTVIPDETTPNKTKTLPAPDVYQPPKTRKKKEIVESPSTEMVRADAVQPNKDTPTIYNYGQTTALLGGTLLQADNLTQDLLDELDNVKQSRTLKNKYMIMTNLSQSVSQLLSTKASILKEINNSITKATELDYKKEKDKKAEEGAANDDKFIMDLYSNMINNPAMANAPTLTPSPINNAVSSSNGIGIIRSPLAAANPAPNGVVDVGYLNYLSRITPEQNSMIMERNPSVQICVVYDVSTGSKFFQCMDTSTGMVVPNMDLPNERFLEDVTIDLANNIAKNTNLRQTYPLVVINNNLNDPNNAMDVLKNY